MTCKRSSKRKRNRTPEHNLRKISLPRKQLSKLKRKKRKSLKKSFLRTVSPKKKFSNCSTSRWSSKGRNQVYEPFWPQSWQVQSLTQRRKLSIFEASYFNIASLSDFTSARREETSIANHLYWTVRTMVILCTSQSWIYLTTILRIKRTLYVYWHSRIAKLSMSSGVVLWDSIKVQEKGILDKTFQRQSLTQFMGTS